MKERNFQKAKKAKAKELGTGKENRNQKVEESRHGLILRGHSSIQRLGKAIIGTRELGKEIKDQRKVKALGNQRKEKVHVRPLWT